MKTEELSNEEPKVTEHKFGMVYWQHDDARQ